MDGERRGIPGQVVRERADLRPAAERPGAEHVGLEVLPGPARMLVGAAAVAAALALAAVIGVFFLTVAPSNVMSQKHAPTIRQWTQPEFEQRWQLFAPDVPKADLRLEARVEVRGKGGQAAEFSDWIDLSGRDFAALRSDLVPARRLATELPNAWAMYMSTHGVDGAPIGHRGVLSERYLRRLALSRLDASDVGGVVEQVQLRALYLPFQPPPWTGERVDPEPVVQLLPWWPVAASDRAAGTDRALVLAQP